jgi:hypothetical protein
LVSTGGGKGPDNMLQDLIKFVKDNGRVCPMPLRWKALWEQLPDRKRNANGGWTPSLPLILGAWNYADEQSKAQRLKDHILWANEKGSLPQVDKYLRDLSEDDWLHEGE